MGLQRSFIHGCGDPQGMQYRVYKNICTPCGSPQPGSKILIIQMIFASIYHMMHCCFRSVANLTCSLWRRSGFTTAPTWQLWLRGNGVLLGTAAVVAVLSLTVLLLLGSHLYLVSLNTTTWEFMSRHRISYLKHCGADENPFDRGALRNLWGFFCDWGAIVWEQVYFREGNDPIWLANKLTN